MPTQKRGTELALKVQRDCLARFVHRFTGDHKPQWANKPWKNEQGKTVAYPLQFTDDQDWLAHTLFTITKDGQLSNRESFCESSPTWPHNPEFRRKG